MKSEKKKVSKNIPVEDEFGNKHIIKATVFSVDPNDIKKSSSSQILDEHDIAAIGLEGKIVEPPLSMSELALLPEYSTELTQITQKIATGINGFGWRITPHEGLTNELKEKFKEQIAKEHEHLTSLFEHPNPKETFTGLSKQMQIEKKTTGNSYWELVPATTAPRLYSCINRINSGTIRITKADRSFTRMPVKFLKQDFSLGIKFFPVKFRRFVQIVNRKKVYFKEFGDPRIIDRRTGEVSDEKLSSKYRANELLHWLTPSLRNTPYGMPEYTGNIISIKGSRQAGETNILVFCFYILSAKMIFS